MRPARKRQSGQSMVEFALSSVVLMLIIGGLIDIGRAVSVSEVLSSAAREGARQGARFDASNVAHTYLTDGQIQGVVDAVLTANSLPLSTLKNPGTTCPAPADGNAYHNPPYAGSAYPSGPNDVWLYICYDNTPGVDFTAPPGGQSQQDLNVIVLYSYGPLTPLISAQFGTFDLAANEHIMVQGP